MCAPNWYWFSAVLVIYRVLILAILVINREWVSYSGLELGMFFGRSYFFINNKTIDESPAKIMFKSTVSAVTVINRVSKFWSGHEQGRENSRLWS